jgi:hypothetical protein
MEGWRQYLEEVRAAPSAGRLGLTGLSTSERYAVMKKQQAIRQKADEEVDFGKWEQAMKKATKDYTAATLALGKPLGAQDKEGVATARENLKQVRVVWRNTLKKSNEILFKYFMTVKKLGGTLAPDEEKILQDAFEALKQKLAASEKREQTLQQIAAKDPDLGRAIKWTQSVVGKE